MLQSKNLNGWNYATITLPIKYRNHLREFEALLEVTRKIDSLKLVLPLFGSTIERVLVEEAPKSETEDTTNGPESNESNL